MGDLVQICAELPVVCFEVIADNRQLWVIIQNSGRFVEHNDVAILIDLNPKVWYSPNIQQSDAIIILMLNRYFMCRRNGISSCT